MEAEEATNKLHVPQPSEADGYGRLRILADATAKRAVKIRESMIPDFADANRLWMEWETLEEAQGCLRRMALMTSTPLDSLEPGREALPQPAIKKQIKGPPSTPAKPRGCSYCFTLMNGVPTWSGGQDV